MCSYYVQEMLNSTLVNYSISGYPDIIKSKVSDVFDKEWQPETI